jgi:hypothetical protein
MALRIPAIPAPTTTKRRFRTSASVPEPDRIVDGDVDRQAIVR